MELVIGSAEHVSTDENSATRACILFKYVGDTTGVVILTGPLIEAWNRSRLGVPLVMELMTNDNKEVWPKCRATELTHNQISATLRTNVGLKITMDDLNKAVNLFKELGLDIDSYHLS